MKEQSKLILGQRLGNMIFFSDEEKKIIIRDYLSGNESKKAVYKKYTGRYKDHGCIIVWMRKFGIEDKFEKSPNFVSMPTRKKDKEQSSEDFETLKLKKRIAELEKQLQTAEMKAIAFSTMVDIAEKEFNIPIRKKHNTKL
jgi:transposase